MYVVEEAPEICGKMERGSLIGLKRESSMRIMPGYVDLAEPRGLPAY